MFTVKVVRVAGDIHHTRLIEAVEVEIATVGERKVVTAIMQSGDSVEIPISGGLQQEEHYSPDGGYANIVFIENAVGKTTDVVRGK